MYPGSNNYDPNYLNQQQRFDTTQQFGGGPGQPSGGPPIGFNVGLGMNQPSNFTGGYAPVSAPYDNYNQYPSNILPIQSYSNQFASQNQYLPGQTQYPPSQNLPMNVQGYGGQQIHNQHVQGISSYDQSVGPQVTGSQLPYGQPMGGQPSYGQPMGGQLSYGQPMSGQPSYGQSSYGQPMSGQLSYGQPIGGQPTYGQPYRQQINNQQIPSNSSGSPGFGYPNTKPQLPINNTPYSSAGNPQTILASIGSNGDSFRGTMKPYPNFNAEQDCNILKKAMKGFGTDEKSIIECLSRRNHSQRLEIKKTYKTMFGKDLLDELKSELSGNFSRAVIESLYDSDYYDAYSLYKAMEGAGTREDVLTEILTSRSNKEIINIKDLYKKYYNKDLEKEVMSETSGFYKRVLVSCLQASKKELTAEDITRLRQQGPNAVVNINMAREEANELYNAGEKKIGTDEACFIKIFATRNKYQLKATFDEYQRIAGRDIITSINREMSGDLASALKAIATQAINPALYFANSLYKAMKGLGTNDTALIRIILTRSEIDLENIKTEFQKQYGKTLLNFIREDTSGDYSKYLSRFVDGN